MKWSEIHRIAEALYDQYPDVNPLSLSFTDLHNRIVDLAEFDDDHARVGDKVLEAIQAAWLEEAK